MIAGSMLDRRYRIDVPIARGGMSVVYRGLDTRLDRPVAVKIMDPKFAEDPQFVARFELEARAVARLTHPGLVAVYDHGRDGEHAFLVMELVEGGTLRELLRERGPMPPHAAVAVVRPVLEALAVAHRAGLVHRDIKPENILISDDGDVKIADFGLVRAVAASNATSASVILGTAAYLSPEQVTTGSASAGSDVYGVGVVLYELLTGRPPFTGDTSLSIAYQRIDNDVPIPSSAIAGVPEQLDAIVRHATVRDPERRYRNADEMVRAVRAASSELQLPDYRVPAPTRSAEHSSAAAGATTSVSGASPPTVAHNAIEDPRHPPRPADGTHHTRVVTTATPREADNRDIDDPSAGPPRPDSTGRRQYDFPDFDADRRRSRRTIVVWLTIVALLAVLVGFGGWWMGSGRYTAVPNVDGLDTTGATSAVDAAGLESEVRGTYSDSVDTDILIGTDPPAGSRIAKGDNVLLLVSLGRPTVPSISGDITVEEMEQELRDRTFTPVDGGEAFSTSAPVGGVAALDPAPGTVLTTGTSVTVLRSKGSPPVPVPEVTGQSVEQARTTLAAVGITVDDVVERFDADVDGGSAIGTDPAEGSTVGSGSSATLLVSNAVTVPSLLGRSVGSARQIVERLGLTIDVRQVVDTDGSLVFTQDPGPGSRTEPGSEVSVVSLP